MINAYTPIQIIVGYLIWIPFCYWLLLNLISKRELTRIHLCIYAVLSLVPLLNFAFGFMGLLVITIKSMIWITGELINRFLWIYYIKMWFTYKPYQ